jgi:hypothetical protein
VQCLTAAQRPNVTCTARTVNPVRSGVPGLPDLPGRSSYGSSATASKVFRAITQLNRIVMSVMTPPRGGTEMLTRDESQGAYRRRGKGRLGVSTEPPLHPMRS